MFKIARAAAVTIAMLGLSAQAQTAAPADVSQDTKWHNEQMLYLVKLQRGDGWSTTPSGLRYRRIKGDGGGARPAPANTVTIHYTGRFIDGGEFDSSITRGEPATFPLPRLIKGWQEGVPLMGVGDTFEFAIPAGMAYGMKGKGPIPGGATLLFTIELIAIPG